MTVAISTLLPDIRMELPGCPTPILEARIYKVLRHFFWESEVWKYSYDNGLDYTLSTAAMPSPVAGTDIPTKTIVKRVDTVKYSSTGDDWKTIVPFRTRDALDRGNPDWRTETGAAPTAWCIDNNGSARLVTIATATVTDGLLIRSIIAPVFTLTTDTLPDFLYYEFEHVFVAGVLGFLMSQPGKDWTNERDGMKYLGMYTNGIKRAKSRAEADFGQPKDTMAYGGL